MTEKTPLRERMTTVQFWRDRVIEVVASMALVFFITTGVEIREENRREAVEATDWFEVHEVYVPDHEVGDNPEMIYDRTIKVPFQGFWIAEVQRRDLGSLKSEQNFAQCTGSLTNDYDLDDIIPDDKVEWSWYLNRPCIIPPGEYRILTTYDLKRPGYPVKKMTTVSNTFRVWAPGTKPAL